MAAVPGPPTDVTAVLGNAVGVSVYSRGVFGWADDWSSIAGINYTCRNPMGLSGKTPCIYIPKAGKWSYWLPYPHTNPGAPSKNLIGCNLKGMTHMTIAVRPTLAGLTPTIGFYRAVGTSVGESFGVGVTITHAQYGPPQMPVGQWSNYIIPLADFQIGTPGWIYQFMVQQHGVTPQAWYLDNVGFY